MPQNTTFTTSNQYLQLRPKATFLEFQWRSGSTSGRSYPATMFWLAAK